VRAEYEKKRGGKDFASPSEKKIDLYFHGGRKMGKEMQKKRKLLFYKFF